MFASLQIKDDTKRPVYCALIQLLRAKDLSVRLAAIRSLCFHIEDANFSEKDFSDLLPVCQRSSRFEGSQIGDANSGIGSPKFNSKSLFVFPSVHALVYATVEVIPYANNLMQFFQRLLCNAPAHSSKGVDINGPDELNLLEGSMLLWEATLSHAPAMVPQLLAYFPCLVEVLERNFDQLQVAVDITEGYIILGGREFLSMHASSVVKLLDLIVGNVNDRGLLSTLPVIDILIRIPYSFVTLYKVVLYNILGISCFDCPTSCHGCKLLHPCYPMEVPPLITSTLQKLVVICLSGGDDGNPSKTAVKASAATILARILVMNTSYLAQLTSEPSLSSLLQQTGVAIDSNILLCLVDIWLDRVDNVSSPQKKIFGLALSIALTLRLPQILDKLDQMLSVCTSVILGGTDDLTEEVSSGDTVSSSRMHGEGSLPNQALRSYQPIVIGKLGARKSSNMCFRSWGVI
ncbi:ARM repeat superfamily protein isoform 2 [Hibiscus syriacus]|uniref:ARM repeat superfamily protein isoform 2 n=1 Tax=Hibiscus syriacus TaxID=106335 RepID=A0A6A3B3T5_HIBSY|nr:ARM repeat superfamily protein isoform 2 [Hibiscus syriacus]